MSQRRAVRIPDDLDRWIESLPPRYGRDYTAKVITLLYIGKEQLERERMILQREEESQSHTNGGHMMVAEKPPKYNAG